MRFLFLLFSFLLLLTETFAQQYKPDFTRHYPFPDSATPFVFQKKPLPSIFRKKEITAHTGENDPLPMVEMLLETEPDTTNETQAARIYRKRLPDDHQRIFENGRQGIKNSEGQVIIPAFYEDLFPAGMVVLAKANGKWGVLDGRGGQILPFNWQFNAAYNGLVFLTDGKRAKVFDSQLNTILDEPATEAKMVLSYNDDLNLYHFKQNGQWSLFHTGEKKLLNGYFDSARHFKDDLFGLALNSQWWLFSLDGRRLSTEAFTSIDPFSKEHTDVFVVKKKGTGSETTYFLLDAEGQVIAGPYHNIATPYSTDPRQDWVQVMRAGKWGIADKKGKVVVPTEFDRITDGYNGYYELWKANKVEQWLSQTTGLLRKQLPVKDRP